MTTPLLTRWDFIVAASAVGTGMALAIVPRMSDAEPGPATRSELTPWIVIAVDNTVTIRVPGPEAGTGGTTQVCMLVAEELQCDWAQVRAEPISYRRNTREGDLYIGQTGTWSTFAGATATTAKVAWASGIPFGGAMRKLEAPLVVDPADHPLGSDIEKAPSR